MSASAVPLRIPLFLALVFAWMWGVIGGSVGLNALIKSNQTQSKFKHKVPPSAVVTVDNKDVHNSGIVLTTIGALIAVLCTVFLLLHVLPATRASLAPRTLRAQAFLLAFCAVWLFAALVPFTVFFATRQAQVHASIGGVTLPAQVIQSVEHALGATTVYRKIGYLRLVAILPWFTLLFTVIAAVVAFATSSRVRRGAGARATHEETRDEEKERRSEEGRTSGVTKE